MVAVGGALVLAWFAVAFTVSVSWPLLIRSFTLGLLFLVREQLYATAEEHPGVSDTLPYRDAEFLLVASIVLVREQVTLDPLRPGSRQPAEAWRLEAYEQAAREYPEAIHGTLQGLTLAAKFLVLFTVAVLNAPLAPLTIAPRFFHAFTRLLLNGFREIREPRLSGLAEETQHMEHELRGLKSAVA